MDINKPPVQTGDILENVFIESIGQKGDGIGKIDGYIIIIPGTEIKKIYKVRILKTYNRFCFAKIIE